MDQLIYLYGFIPNKEIQINPLPNLNGLDENQHLYTIHFEEVSAIVSDLNPNEYNEDEINKKIDDPEWLHQKAFQHHETIIELNKLYTLIPMRFCTIYSSENSLRNTLNNNYPSIFDSLKWLSNKAEWNLKIYCDNTTFKKLATKNNTNIQEKQAEIAKLSPGRRYLEERKLEQYVQKELEKSKNQISNDIHDVLSTLSVHSDVKKKWSQNVTGLDQEMCWNSVYLIHSNETNSFLKQVQSFNTEWKDYGFQLQIVGPWPSYHFANQLQKEDQYGA